MSLTILFHFLCTQHVSDINISIIRSMRLCCWITTSVVLFSFRCVLEIWCGWVWVVSVLQASYPSSGACDCNTDTTQTQPHQISNTQRTENKTPDVVNQQHSRKLLMVGLKSATRTLLKPSRTKSPTQQTKNKTTDVVIQQHSRKLLMMDILMSKTCWVHKKWNKITSDIKLVFYSSAITMMHGPVNINSRCLPCSVHRTH